MAPTGGRGAPPKGRPDGWRRFVGRVRIWGIVAGAALGVRLLFPVLRYALHGGCRTGFGLDGVLAAAAALSVFVLAWAVGAFRTGPTARRGVVFVQVAAAVIAVADLTIAGLCR